jgi:hypothetical protein
MRIKLKSVFINDKKSDGTPYKDKNGNPFKMCMIESENGNKASMFLGKFQEKQIPVLQTWKAGDTVDVIIEKNGEYTNFNLMTKTDLLEERVKKLEEAVFSPEKLVKEAGL